LYVGSAIAAMKYREREIGVLVSVCSNNILPMLFIYDRSMAAIYDKATALTNPRDF
jgi:hypothetical protein